MATDQAIGELAGKAMDALMAEMGRLAGMAGLDPPALPTNRDARLQAAKRLDVIARFMAQANDALVAQAYAKLSDAAQAPAAERDTPPAARSKGAEK